MCGTELWQSYTTHIVEAKEVVHSVSPGDAQGPVVTVRAIAVCSWACLTEYLEES